MRTLDKNSVNICCSRGKYVNRATYLFLVFYRMEHLCQKIQFLGLGGTHKFNFFYTFYLYTLHVFVLGTYGFNTELCISLFYFLHRTKFFTQSWIVRIVAYSMSGTVVIQVTVVMLVLLTVVTVLIVMTVVTGITVVTVQTDLLVGNSMEKVTGVTHEQIKQKK